MNNALGHCRIYQRSLPAALAIVLAGTAAAAQPEADPPELAQRVTEFFRAGDTADRSTLLREILRDPQADLATISDLVKQAQLWEAVPAGLHTLEAEYGDGLRTRARVRVPQGYDATRRYPLILGLHGMGQSASEFIHYLEQIVGPAIEDFVVAAPQDYCGVWFLVTQDEAEEPVAVLQTLRRRFHLDTDRVYVVGYSMGGHGAVMSAVLYTDWFASAVALAGTYTTPNTPETMASLLPNLTDFPMLLVWGAQDARDRLRRETPDGGIAGLNRKLRVEFPKFGVERGEFIELTGEGHHDVVPPRERFLEYLRMQRSPDPATIAHRFRFPAQGRRGWLRQTRFAGEPWEGQMVVRVPPGGDVHAYARSAVQRKLALLEGAIEGQTIRVRMLRTREAEIRLHGALLDLDQPITVYRDRKIVFKGVVQPKVSTLLTEARADWEFQHPPSVRLVVPWRGKAGQE